jgi:ferrous iron transport protein B
MSAQSGFKIALIGNPNAGKSTVFNQLTGLNQKVGNFPGVTVDKHSGFCKLPSGKVVEIIDLPGTYSLYPKSEDEKIVIRTLIHPDTTQRPDLILVIADAANLKRNLLIFTQVKDLGLPAILILNQIDIAEKRQMQINLPLLKKGLFTEDILTLNARKGQSFEGLKNLIDQKLAKLSEFNQTPAIVNATYLAPETVNQIQQKYKLANPYWAFQYAQQVEDIDFLSSEDKNEIYRIKNEGNFDAVKMQAKETLARFEIIEDLLQSALQKPNETDAQSTFSEKIDQIFLHRLWGYLIFFGLLFLIFIAIFQWAELPMQWIEGSFAWLKDTFKALLPAGALTDLLIEGVLAGLEGIVVFVPQIAILFGFIALLEESGYMARVVFMMDKLMRVFGLNGRSVVPLISGAACAVPAIMATRTIDNRKERFITIFVTPLISCSARLPVYVILIGLVVPNQLLWGFLPLPGVALMAMYLLGFVMALITAILMKIILKTKEKSFLIMELPAYKMPSWKNVGNTIFEKVKVFVWEAGKIILAISIILWVMASYGPSDSMQKAENQVKADTTLKTPEQKENKLKQLKLENSYAGYFGKVIEPVISPLGYDWKIGIALLTSFAAREVFVGTISTIYNIGSEDNEPVRQRMQAEINPKTGKPIYSPATAFSLLVFYAFAMQCMSTFAVVYRETKGWKWPIIQFIYLTGLAYLAALLIFNVLS